MKHFLLAALLAASTIVYSQNALDFDGSNDYVQSSNPGPIGAANRTVEAWIKTTTSISTQQVILDWGDMALGNRFTLNMINFGKLRIEVGGSGFNSTTSIADGNWHHVAVSYDNAATTKFSMYIDGVLEGSQNLTQAVNTASTNGIIIGRRNDGVNYFNGIIDEVRIWNTVRTLTEISNNRNLEFCTIPAGLVAYYQFNQGNAGASNSGKNKLIEVANSNIGTLNGFSLSGTSSNWVTGASLTPGLSASYSNQSACDSLVSPSGMFTWSSSGLKRDSMSNALNCDSFIYVNLTINNTAYTQTTDSFCEEVLSPSGKYVYTTSGTYYDTTTTSKGCPNYHTLEYQITINDTTVSVNGQELTSNQASAQHYIWLDCANDFAQISGSNNRVFKPTKNGEYAVRITNGKCIDTSECITVTGVGLNDLNVNDRVSIYPNPVREVLTIQLSQTAERIIVSLLNISGQEILSKNMSSTDKAILNLKDLPAGLYFLQVTADGVRWQERLIKK